MTNTLQLVYQTRLVAILRLDDLSNALPLSRALLEAGVVAQEFTLTNPQALEAIRAVLAEIEEFSHGRATVGVGSVRNEQQCRESIEAGAQFVVTPIHVPHVASMCVEQGVPLFSGAFTPTEIATAWDAGASLVKVFPARGLGPTYIKDVLAPMPELKLMPTGGIDLENIHSYFQAGATAVGVGGNLLDPQAVAGCDWKRVTLNASQYVRRAAKEIQS